SVDGRTLFTATNHGSLAARDRDTARVRWTARSKRNPMLNAMALAPDGRTIATGGICVEVWDAATGRLDHVADVEHGYRSALACSPEGGWLATMEFASGSIVLVDASSLEVSHRFPGRPHGSSLAFSPDSRTLAAGAEDGVIEIWTVGR